LTLRLSQRSQYSHRNGEGGHEVTSEGIRQMPEIQEIGEFLRNMKFKKKVIGGCDEESVLDYILEVTEMYEKIILDLINKREPAKPKPDKKNSAAPQTVEEILAEANAALRQTRG